MSGKRYTKYILIYFIVIINNNWQPKHYLFDEPPFNASVDVAEAVFSRDSASFSALALSLASCSNRLASASLASLSASALSSSACSCEMAESRSWFRFPPFHRRRIRSASVLTCPCGWKGFSQPSLSLKLDKNLVNTKHCYLEICIIIFCHSESLWLSANLTHLPSKAYF